MVQRGEDLIISVELVDVERQAQLWGGRYNRKMADPVAYRLLLRAQHCFQNEWPAGSHKSIAFCQRAIEIDPAYAPAYAQLSTAYAFRGISRACACLGGDSPRQGSLFAAPRSGPHTAAQNQALVILSC
jgi:hypothetical protein